jgi:hypothetical protein
LRSCRVSCALLCPCRAFAERTKRLRPIVCRADRPRRPLFSFRSLPAPHDQIGDAGNGNGERKGDAERYVSNLILAESRWRAYQRAQRADKLDDLCNTATRNRAAQ